MSATDEITAEILRLVPEYARSLEDLREDWRPEEPELCMRLSALVWWMTSEIGTGRRDFGRLPEYLDSLLESGSKEVRDAVASCFVENLVNRAPELIPRDLLQSLLGVNGRQVAESWEKF
jgi:hypothetical protein